MSKNLTHKKRLSKVESTRKTFKIFALSFHGTNLEVIGKDLARQMESRLSKKIYPVMVNGEGGSSDGDQTISEATELEHQSHEIEEGIRRCKTDFESVWESLTSTLSEDLRKYWSEDVEDIAREFESTEGDESEKCFPKKFRKSDLQILNSEIKDFETCDYYIVLIGKFSNETLIDLLISNQPLQAIIHFIPCPEFDLEVNFPKLHEDIDFLRKSPDTKNVGIFIENFNPVPILIPDGTTSEYIPASVEEGPQKYSQQIYDQFTWYLYDIEMLTQQFIVYQTDFVEINDAELPSQEELLWSKFVRVESGTNNKDTNDAGDDGTPAAVGVFLDNLFTAIENRANLERKNSSSNYCYLSPFLENNYGRIIVEEANELLRSAVANQFNVVTYWKLVNMITRSGPVCGISKYVECGIDDLPEFYELLSWEAFVQRVEARRNLYDECCQVDVSKGCKLLIFRRSFNRAVEVRKKFQLPTRLCLRDFCSCIAPNLANFLRNFETHTNSHEDFNGIPRFTGLVFDESLQELEVFEKIFRFRDGSISCSVENWSNEDKMISVKIHLFDNSVYFYPRKNRISKIRLITKNNISCNIEISQDQLHPSVFLQWPNGCQIRYINEDNLAAIEQSYPSKDRLSEIRRLYTLEGFVIRYLRNERIEVLTPNGIIYMLYIVQNASYTDLNFEISSQEDINAEISDEINFVRNLEKYGIFCDKFDVTLADGSKLRLSLDGNMQEEIDNFLIYEWTDYFENKKFLDRDDGVKMVWSSDFLRCYYPCGTVITTKVVEDCIRTNFGCETNLMDNIFENTNPTFVAKGSNKAKRQDSYVTYNLNYLMQHKNYATVEVCGKDKMEIHSPNGFKLILKQDDVNRSDEVTTVNIAVTVVVVVVIDIGEELSFRIAAGVCTIHSGVSIPEKKKISLQLNLFPDVTNIILSFQNPNSSLNLGPKGEMILNKINPELSAYDETSYFLSKENLFGIEFVSKENYDLLISRTKNEKYLFESPTQLVLLETILPIDDQFSMLTASETIKDLKHFQPVVCHENRLKPEKSDRIFTARVINKLDGPVEALAFVKNTNFNENSLENQLNTALSYFFDKKTKPEDPKWRIKIKALHQDLVNKKQRKRFYSSMLKHKIFPNYHEFRNLNNNVKLLNVENIK